LEYTQVVKARGDRRKEDDSRQGLESEQKSKVVFCVGNGVAIAGKIAKQELRSVGREA
jgi:hypothetical protein